MADISRTVHPRGATTRRVLTAAQLRAEDQQKFEAEMTKAGIPVTDRPRGIADMPTRPGPTDAQGGATRHG